MSGNNGQCVVGIPCAVVQVLEEKIDTQEGRIAKMEDAIEALRNRLPLWATMAFTACGAIIGFLANRLV